MPPPFQTQFRQQPKNNPSQMIANIGALQQGRAQLQLGKERLQFDREQAQITQARERQHTMALAEAANIEGMKFDMEILSNPSLPDAVLTGAMDDFEFRRTGVRQKHSIEDTLPRYGSGQKILKAIQLFGMGSEQVQTMLQDHNTRFPPMGVVGDGPQKAKHYGNYDFNDFGRFTVLKDGHLDDEEQRTIASLVDMQDKVGTLAFLRQARVMREADGQPVSPEVESLIQTLEIELKTPGATPQERAALDGAQQRAAKGHRLRSQAESSKAMSAQVYKGEEVSSVRRTADEITRFFTNNPHYEVLKQAVELATDPKEKALEQRILDGYVTSKSRRFLDSMQRELSEAAPLLKQGLKDDFPTMRSQAERAREDAIRRGEDPGIYDLQLLSLEQGEVAIRGLIKAGTARDVNGTEAELLQAFDLALAEERGTPGLVIRDQVLTPILAAADTMQGFELQYNDFIAQGENEIRQGQATREHVVQGLLNRRNAEAVSQQNLRDAQAQEARARAVAVGQPTVGDVRDQQLAALANQATALGIHDPEVLSKLITSSGAKGISTKDVADEMIARDTGKVTLHQTQFTGADGKPRTATILQDPDNPNDLTVVTLDTPEGPRPAIAEKQPLINFGSAGERKELKDAEVILGQLDDMEDLFDPANVGPIDTFLDRTVLRPLGKLTDAQQDFIQTVNEFEVEKVNDLFGAAFTATEAKKAADSIPNLRMQDDQLRAAMRTTKRNIRRAIKILRENTGKPQRDAKSRFIELRESGKSVEEAANILREEGFTIGD